MGAIHKRHSEFDAAVARNLWNMGMSDVEIAEEMGCHSKTVQAHRKQAGLKPNRPNKPKRSSRLEIEADAAYHLGMSYGQYKANLQMQQFGKMKSHGL